MRYRPLGGEAEIAPGALSEAIGQLASWLCIQRNDFTARPVFLFADHIKVHGAVQAGSDVELHADLLPLLREHLANLRERHERFRPLGVSASI